MQLKNTFLNKAKNLKEGTKKFGSNLRNQSLRSSHQTKVESIDKTSTDKSEKNINFSKLFRRGLFAAVSALSLSQASGAIASDYRTDGLLSSPTITPEYLSGDSFNTNLGLYGDESQIPESIRSSIPLEPSSVSRKLVFNQADLPQRPDPLTDSYQVGDPGYAPTITSTKSTSEIRDLEGSSLSHETFTGSEFLNTATLSAHNEVLPPHDMGQESLNNSNIVNLDTIASGRGYEISQADLIPDETLLVSLQTNFEKESVAKIILIDPYSMDGIKSEKLKSAIENSETKSYASILANLLESYGASRDLAVFIAGEYQLEGQVFNNAMTGEVVYKMFRAIYRLTGDEGEAKNFLTSFEHKTSIDSDLSMIASSEDAASENLAEEGAEGVTDEKKWYEGLYAKIGGGLATVTGTMYALGYIFGGGGEKENLQYAHYEAGHVEKDRQSAASDRFNSNIRSYGAHQMTVDVEAETVAFSDEKDSSAVVLTSKKTPIPAFVPETNDQNPSFINSGNGYAVESSMPDFSYSAEEAPYEVISSEELFDKMDQYNQDYLQNRGVVEVANLSDAEVEYRFSSVSSAVIEICNDFLKYCNNIDKLPVDLRLFYDMSSGGVAHDLSPRDILSNSAHAQRLAVLFSVSA